MSKEVKEVKFKSLQEFYPFYLSQHQNRINRRLHVIGTTIGIFWLLIFLLTLNPKFFAFGLVSGYSFAWVGHFFFEKNTPATFKHPFYSFA